MSSQTNLTPANGTNDPEGIDDLPEAFDTGSEPGSPGREPGSTANGDGQPGPGLIKKKRPALWVALLLLPLPPGLSLLYMGVWRRGWIVLGLVVLGFVLQIALSLLWAPQSYAPLMVAAAGLIALYGLCFLWALVDLIISRRRFRRHGYPQPFRRLGPRWAFALGALIMVVNGLGAATLSLMGTARTLHPFSIPSGSMLPGLEVGDLFIAVRPTSQPLARGELLVFKTKALPGAPFHVKRLIGLPGDRIALEGHRAIVNGQAEGWHSRDPSVPGAVRACLPQRCYDLQIGHPGSKYGANMSERSLGEDEYFFLGDHRDNSLDSRFSSVGAIPRAQIYYRGYQIYWPPHNWRRLY